jgi:hypothetical protein
MLNEVNSTIKQYASVVYEYYKSHPMVIGCLETMMTNAVSSMPEEQQKEMIAMFREQISKFDSMS